MLNILILLLLFPQISHASDIYFGKYIVPYYRSNPGGGNAKFVAGINLDKTFYDRFTPSVTVETLMDNYNGNGTFHPSSVKYDFHFKADIYEGGYIDISRMCWHSIDSYERTEQYWLIKAGYKW